MFPRNRGKILNICYRIFHYIHSSKELCRAKRMIDRRAFKHLIFLFFFLANIDLIEKFIQTKLANYSSFWFDKSYDKSILRKERRKRPGKIHHSPSLFRVGERNTRFTEILVSWREEKGKKGSARRQQQRGWRKSKSRLKYILHNCWTTYRFYAAPVRSLFSLHDAPSFSEEERKREGESVGKRDRKIRTRFERGEVPVSS